MQLAQAIAHHLKQSDLPDEDLREMRALTTAQFLAFEIPLEPGCSARETFQRHQTTLENVVDRVNDTLPVDIKLTLAYVREMLGARLELTRASVDPALAAYVLDSDAQDVRLNPDQRQRFAALLSNTTVKGNLRLLHAQYGGCFDTPDTATKEAEDE